MTGRRPLPTNIKVLRGNPGKRPLNENEPQPRKGRPVMPAHVKDNDEAAREWRRMCDILDDMGLLTKADRAALSAYCVAWSRWVEAENKVREFGMILKAPKNGYPMPSPYLTIAKDAMSQMHKLLIEFGLTPASRTRLSTTKPTASDDFDAWERRRA